MSKWVWIVLASMLAICGSASAQGELERCIERPFLVELPRVNPLVWCLQQPMIVDTPSGTGVTDFVYMNDGILYATKPYERQIVRLLDTDGDALPDTEEIFLEDLDLPNAIVTDGDMLYILGDGILYRYADGDLETLIEDLPSGRGFIMAGLLLQDEYLYIGIPMPCDVCESDNPRHGTVERYDLDGSNRTTIARGLRYPSGLGVLDDILWITDSGRDYLRPEAFADEINTMPLISDTVPHFGFPYCIGQDNRPDVASDFDCTEATAPAYVFPTGTTPFRLLPYEGSNEYLQGDMLVVMAGSTNMAQMWGFQIARIGVQPNRVLVEPMLPADESIAGRSRQFFDAGSVLRPSHTLTVSRRWSGLFPRHPYALAINPEGWLITGVSGGMLYSLSPGDHDPCEVYGC